jgi:hypothetical protein
MNRIKHAGLVTLALALTNLSPLLAATVSIPFIDNFDTSTADPNFQITTNGAQSNYRKVSDGNGGYAQQIDCGVVSGFQYSTAMLNPSGYGTSANPLGFVMASDFSIAAATPTTYYIGLTAFSSNSNLSQAMYSGGATVDWACISQAGALNIIQFVQGNGSTSGGWTLGSQIGSNLTMGLSYNYTMSLTGSYNALNQLTLTFEVANLTLGQTASISATSNYILPNNASSLPYFGIMERNATSSGTLSVDYDNFSFSAIPEPSTYVLIGIGLATLVFLRRKSHRQAN